MALLWGKPYSKSEILRRVGDIRQLARVEPVELVDGVERGVRAVRLRNSGGLDLTVVTDRGMAISDLAFQGVPQAFLTGVGVAHPAYTEQPGLGWLRTWPGGFLTPCGLTQVGSPCEDMGESLGQHGRVAGIPAREVRWGGEWKDDDYFLWVEGTVRQVAMFGEDISMRRRIGTWLGGTRFWIEDTIQNHSFKPVPLMFLQHFNLGFPLVDAGTRLELPDHVTQARDVIAQAGIEGYHKFEEPQAGYKEEVFYHNMQPGPNGQVEVRLVNPNYMGGRELCVYWRYTLSDYPILVEWKMMGEGSYVVGIEPSNCRVGGRCAERERGTLQELEPFATRRYRIEVGFRCSAGPLEV
jgi:hypothetical protein